MPPFNLPGLARRQPRALRTPLIEQLRERARATSTRHGRRS